MTDFDWGGLIESVAPALVGLGTGLIMNNQNKQQAIGVANNQQQALQTQYEIAQKNQENLVLQNQLNQPKAPTTQKSNTALYISLGVGGVALLGIVIFAVTRK